MIYNEMREDTLEKGGKYGRQKWNRIRRSVRYNKAF